MAKNPHRLTGLEAAASHTVGLRRRSTDAGTGQRTWKMMDDYCTSKGLWAFGLWKRKRIQNDGNIWNNCWKLVEILPKMTLSHFR